MENNKAVEGAKKATPGVFDKVISYALRNDIQKHNIKKGNSKATEHYAYEEILPRLPEGTSRDKDTVALRLAAILAMHNIHQNNSISFGRWLSLNVNDNETNVKTKLERLSSLDAENAVQSIGRILTLLSSKGAPLSFNVYGLGRTLEKWGNGQSENSIIVRQIIIRDFYIAKRLSNNEEEKED